MFILHRLAFHVGMKSNQVYCELGRSLKMLHFFIACNDIGFTIEPRGNKFIFNTRMVLVPIGEIGG